MKIKTIISVAFLMLCSFNNYLYSQPIAISWDELAQRGFTFIDKPAPTCFDADFMTNASIISIVESDQNKTKIEIYKSAGIPRYGIIFDSLGNVMDTVLYFDNSITSQLMSGIFMPYIYNDSLTLVPSYSVTVLIMDITTGEVVLKEVATLPATKFRTIGTITGVEGMPTKVLLDNEQPYKIGYENLPAGVYFISFFNPNGEMIYIKTITKN